MSTSHFPSNTLYDRPSEDAVGLAFEITRRPEHFIEEITARAEVYTELASLALKNMAETLVFRADKHVLAEYKVAESTYVPSEALRISKYMLFASANLVYGVAKSPFSYVKRQYLFTKFRHSIEDNNAAKVTDPYAMAEEVVGFAHARAEHYRILFYNPDKYPEE